MLKFDNYLFYPAPRWAPNYVMCFSKKKIFDHIQFRGSDL